MDHFGTWTENVALLILPYLLFGIAFLLDRYNVSNWIIRKYIHTIGLITAGVYASFIQSLAQIILLVGVLLVTVFLFSLPPIRLLQNITRMGNREGESQAILLINGLSTAIAFVILVLIFFDFKWIILGAILSVAIGDGLGEFIGRPFGKHQYKIFSTKSVEGSLAVFGGSLFGGIISVLGFYTLTPEVFVIILLASILVTLVEAVSVLFMDNIVMQYLYAGTLWYFLVR